MGNEFKFYRHKIYKDIYLAKCTRRTGDEPEEYYFATRYLYGAIQDASASGFENLMNKTRGEGEAELVAEMVDEKYVNIDGYKGMIKKKLTFKVSDFERVILEEKRHEEPTHSDRERLASLIRETPDVTVWPDALSRIAKHLIANGVTFREG